MKTNIFVALSTFAEYGNEPLKMLQDSGSHYWLNTSGKRLLREEIIEMGRDADGIIAGVEPYDDFVIDRLPRLQCISRCGVGIDNINLAKAKECGINIFNTPDVVIQPVAELTVAMIFDLMRKLSYHTGLLKLKIWEKKAGNLLTRKSIGILGLGRIGKKVAEIMVNIGATVYGADIAPDTLWASRLGVKIMKVDELLKTSDILCIHISPLNDAPFFLGKNEIALMKKGALIINVSRGQLVDHDALYEALARGHLNGAALDVFPQEPYYGNLCEFDNVVLTPHIATLTEESRLQMEIEATYNLISYFKNKEGKP